MISETGRDGATMMPGGGSFAVGNWVADGTQIARVKFVHEDGLLDLVMYDRAGTRLGRTSPAMGGPRHFEPCCSPEGWRPIEEPGFPLSNFAFLRDVVYDRAPSDD